MLLYVLRCKLNHPNRILCLTGGGTCTETMCLGLTKCRVTAANQPKHFPGTSPFLQKQLNPNMLYVSTTSLYGLNCLNPKSFLSVISLLLVKMQHCRHFHVGLSRSSGDSEMHRADAARFGQLHHKSCGERLDTPADTFICRTAQDSLKIEV